MPQANMKIFSGGFLNNYLYNIFIKPHVFNQINEQIIALEGARNNTIDLITIDLIEHLDQSLNR